MGIVDDDGIGIRYVDAAMAYRGLGGHRAVRIWFRLHGLYLVYDLPFGRAIQDIALFSLYGIYGSLDDASRPGCRGLAGISWL